jgi:hypothetical protein
MSNARGKSLDTTYLSIDTAEGRGFIHRDYIAHCLRWTHVVKRLYERKSYQTTRLLDIGCGRELPLAKTLYSSRLSPQMYFGVDAGPINDEDLSVLTKTGKFPLKVWEHTNLLELDREDVELPEQSQPPPELAKVPNMVTCFEVLEHVEPSMMHEMLEHVKKLTSPDCRYFFSTPCWNRQDCAANHVNEMLYEALGYVFEMHGFNVEHVYGTFASIRDYEHLLPHAIVDAESDEVHLPTIQVFNALREYYDTNFLSCIFAPLFPAQSRNCLWELSRQKSGDMCTFGDITMLKEPWSSSDKWEEMRIR